MRGRDDRPRGALGRPSSNLGDRHGAGRDRRCRAGHGNGGLLGTGLSARGIEEDRDFLVRFPLILGGWVLAIVVFAMVSTIGVALQGRARELAGQRLLGATPRQVSAMVTIETVVVATVAAVPGIGAGHLLGAGLLNGIRHAGLVDGAVGYTPGGWLSLLAALLIVASAAVSAWAGSRAVASSSPIAEPARTPVSRRAGRVRRLLAVAVGSATSLTVLTVDPAGIMGTALTGPACVSVAVGLSLLAAELLAAAVVVLGRIPALRSAIGHLAARNLAAAPQRARPAVTFLTLLIVVAAGTLSIQGIENRHGAADGEGQLLAVVNYLVVILIAAFMAIALANNLVAAISRRATEFATMRLVGATDEHLRRMLLGEALTAVAISTAAGGLGAVLATMPFAVLKSGGVAGAFMPLPYVLSAMVSAGVTLAVTELAARRVIHSVSTAPRT
ncbi:ABC transporter permease [Nocardia neocaledoniensis]|uniref:ABC transporter permease n=1 Tax=Nocardia neocaledoniensis TaxID=236511 RepID=UPI0033DA2278